MSVAKAAIKITQGIIKAIPKGQKFAQVASSQLRLSDDVARFLPSFCKSLLF